RLTLFARGVRGPKAKLAALLQPFRLLLLSFRGRGEAPSLTGAEPASPWQALPAADLMGAFYLNELVLKLTLRHDPHPALFDAYHGTLENLKQGGALAPALRIFEKRLLAEVGYGLDLDAESPSGRQIAAEIHYSYHPDHGLVEASPDAPGAVAGHSLLSLARERFADAAELDDARRLLGAALAHCLEGRDLATRAVARSVARGGRAGRAHRDGPGRTRP
ncbi:MAG: DNA repair protein RecO, partial [Steroidobacteraceae bacterium]